jgi:hypothetical protein
VRITVEVSEEILKAAEARERHIVEFAEELMARGLETLAPRPSMSDAIERIRALRSATAAPRV